MGTQRANNTKTFLGKINTRLNSRYQAAIGAAETKSDSGRLRYHHQ